MSFKSAFSKLKRIPEAQDKFNIFTSINLKAEDQLRNSYANGILSKTLVGVKDNIITKELPTTCSSKILEGYKSPFDATVVELLNNAGATIAGKTNMDEFGMGSGGIHSYFGPTYNPIFDDEKIICGGSSSGSGAAVAADVVDFALGTDTGGSVRLPAAYTSCIGFKPSYGRISRFGVISYAQSLDTVGIMAKDIGLVKKVYSVLDKHDPKDPTSLSDELRLKAASYHSQKKVLKIGIPVELLQPGMNEAMKNALNKVVEKLLAKGHELYPVSIPAVKNCLPIYYTLAPAEAASNLSRYDGVRYGYRDAESDAKDDVLFAPTRANFGREVRDRLLLGNYNLCSDGFQNNFLKAQRLRVALIDEFDGIFSFPNVLTGNKPNQEGIDLLLSSTSMNLPATVESYTKKDTNTPISSYINDIFTLPMSLAGLPCISIPVNDLKGVGIQLTAQYANDRCVLDTAEHILL
ncbi:HFR098Cp [Eremothecium sinecaudum]|uniref:Glutamyl-tRNA(Gln) amidotransferase subunit A, mitochondrial n=1 Tax=Eremothecium sinecaudum TaxID=45286 RepID=A0A0X8HV37_9SACH|nr:HFR098Cp [Eremothecium sinecaudum]AMD21953.1 HFR098Cp [Eremothecium sinecaudum]